MRSSTLRLSRANLAYPNRWPTPLAPIDIAPCGILRGASVLRKFDFACLNRLGLQTRAAAEGVDFYCVKQSFFIASTSWPSSEEMQAELFIQRLSKSSVVFAGSLIDSRTGVMCATVARTFVRVQVDGTIKRGLPFEDEERENLAPETLPPGLAMCIDEKLPEFSDTALSALKAATEKAPIFAQTVLPHHMNMANHLDHGSLLSFAADAAATARGVNFQELAAAPSQPVAGTMEYLDGGGACGARLDCFADSSGRASTLRRTTDSGSAVDVCRATWLWK